MWRRSLYEPSMRWTKFRPESAANPKVSPEFAKTWESEAGGEGEKPPVPLSVHSQKAAV